MDNGVSYNSLSDAYKSTFYKNLSDPIDGIDNDGNGYVDDFTGLRPGPEWNSYYAKSSQVSGSHGQGSALEAAQEILRMEKIAGKELPVSIMPVDVYGGTSTFQYNTIFQAAEYGAKVISVSFLMNHSAREYVSQRLKDYDAILVVPDRDGVNSTNNDVGNRWTAYDNVIEVGLLSDKIVRGNGNVDLLEMGSTISQTSESSAVATTAGKIGAIWSLNPEWNAAELVDFLGRVTDTNHPVIAQQGLSSEMGGRLNPNTAHTLVSKLKAASEDEVKGDDTSAGAKWEDTPSAIDIPSENPVVTTPEEEPADIPDEKPVPDQEQEGISEGDGQMADTSTPTPENAIHAAGHVYGTSGDDTFVIGSTRADVRGRGGEDTFIFEAASDTTRHHVRDFREGETLDVSRLFEDVDGPASDYVRLSNPRWGEHTILQVNTDGKGFKDLALLSNVEISDLDEATSSGTIIFDEFFL